MNLPNKITISRVVMIGLMIISLMVLEIVGATTGFKVSNLGSTSINIVNLVVCIVFVIAAATDWLDGYLARKLNMITDFGKFMDPLADKLLVNSILIFLCFPQSYVDAPYTIPFFFVVIMIVRDFAVDGLRLLAVQKKQVIAANIFGKLKTVFQMLTIPVLLLGGWPFSLFDGGWPYYAKIPMILLMITTLVSVVSGIIYFIQNRGVFREQKNEHKEI